mmetsp:Transcript_4676/g.11333  ORF Transcript_4676/g.11333 Transcript_4676/m.11333 type:complete len:239 (-) Transcript_4676:2991-3707(-)
MMARKRLPSAKRGLAPPLEKTETGTAMVTSASVTAALTAVGTGTGTGIAGGIEKGIEPMTDTRRTEKGAVTGILKGPGTIATRQAVKGALTMNVKVTGGTVTRGGVEAPCVGLPAGDQGPAHLTGRSAGAVAATADRPSAKSPGRAQIDGIGLLETRSGGLRIKTRTIQSRRRSFSQRRTRKQSFKPGGTDGRTSSRSTRQAVTARLQLGKQNQSRIQTLRSRRRPRARQIRLTARRT